MQTITWDLDTGMRDPHAIAAARLHVTKRNVAHVQPFHELAFFEAGGGRQLHGDRRHEAAEGDLFFLPAGDWHIAQGSPSTSLIVVNFYSQAFAPSIPADAEALEVIRCLQDRARARDCRVPLSDDTRPEVRERLTDMVRECEAAGPGARSAVKIHLHALLLLLLRRAPLGMDAGTERGAAVSADASERIEAVLAHIRDHLSRPLLAGDLARLARMNRTTFHEVFRELTGHTPVNYVNRLRVHRASELLEKGALPVPEIGNRCGFPCRSHFHSVFKSFTGHTPCEYRREHKPHRGAAPDATAGRAGRPAARKRNGRR